MVTPSPSGPRARWLAALPFVILLAASVAYAVVFGYITILRLQSFNSSIDDLGFFNEVMWITVHGGPNAWTTYAQANFYASYPWQTATFLLLVPAYAAFPSPDTLLVAQAVGIPLATIPIYLLARRYRFSGWASLGFGGCYLLNFQLHTANLLDFHLQSFFPLTFFSMVLFYEYGWKKSFLVVGVISLVTNPLTLVLTFCFLGAQLLKECSPGPTFSKLLHRFRDWVRARNAEFLLLLLGVVLGVLGFAAGWIGGYHIGGSTVGSGPQGYFSTVPTRLVILALTFAPFLAAAFFVRTTAILTLPLLVFLAVANMGYFVPIGRQDSIEFLVVALWGLMLFASQHRGARLRAKVTRALPKRRSSASFRSRRSPDSNLTVVSAVAVSAIFFVTLSPVSPWNQVPQLVGDLNEKPSAILDITPADHFLDSAIALIPANAPVLTQNNIPQLTGRDSIQWAISGKPSPNLTQAEYILSDQSSNSFALDWYYYLQPYVETALDSKQFGVLAMGYGVLLLQRGYHGPPELLAPLSYSPSQLSLASGYRTSSSAVHPAANDSVFWYGPYVDLPTGNYTAAFRLMIGPGARAPAYLLSVAVSRHVSAGTLIYAASQVNTGQFSAPGTWVNVTLSFTLDRFTPALEFPGSWLTNAATVYFGGVTVTLHP